VDMRRMREDAELIAATDGAYAILGGDMVDNHIKHQSAKLAARSQPHDQWKLCEHYLSIFAEKIIVMIDGNHDKWTDQIAGIDMVNWIARNKRLYYAPDEARIDLTVGKTLYKLAVRHQYRFNSSLNLLHTVKRWWAHGEEPFDIGCIGHHHEAAIETFRFHGATCWGCRPGSYQISSAYSRQFGFNATVPRAPSFILFPDERRILGFPDIRDALKTLKAER
jgi:predicted phosphodiesterase